MNQHIEKIVREYATTWSSGDVARFVAYEWIQSGTQSGGFGTLVPGGDYYEVKAASILDFDHDLIRRGADYWDLATSLKQMGHLDVELIP